MIPEEDMRTLLPCIAAAVLFQAAPAMAEVYPTKPITIVVPFAAGGPVDTMARGLEEPMSATLGQPIIIENVAGAAGSTGVGHVVRASPDGYTIGVGHWGTHVLNGAIYPLPYDLINDLAPVVRLP